MMCLLLYHANHIKLLDKVADDMSEVRYNLMKKQKQNWRNDSSLFIMETDVTGHKSIRVSKSKWVSNFSWKFWKMWKIGNKESDKHVSSQVKMLLLPKKSEISIVPVVSAKTDSLHIIIPSTKPHFDWKFWKKKSTNVKSIRYYADISGEQSGQSKSEKQLAEKLLRRKKLKEKSTSRKRTGRDAKFTDYLYKKDKCRTHLRRGSFIDSFAVNGKLIEKSWKKISLQDHLFPPCPLLKQSGPQHMIVASAVDTSEDNEWEDEIYTDSDYSDESYYFDSSSKFFVGRNLVSPDGGVQDKKKEWLTRDDTLIKEADITDPGIKKRDIIPRRKRRSKFGSFDMKTTIASETPSPQSPYAKKRISKLFVRKVPPKSKPKTPGAPAKSETTTPQERAVTPPPKSAETPSPKRAETPPPKPQQAHSEPSYEIKPQWRPKINPRPNQKQQPPPDQKQQPPDQKQQPQPKRKPLPEPKSEPVYSEPQPASSVKRELTELSLAKLRIPLRLANRKLQIRIPKCLLLDSIGEEQQDEKQRLEEHGRDNIIIRSRGGKVGVRGLNSRSRKVLLDSRHRLQAVGLDVLEDDPQPGCIFKRAFGCFSSGSDSSETRDDENSSQKPSLSVRGGKGEKIEKKGKYGISTIHIKIGKTKKPCGTTMYRCLRFAQERGICCEKLRKINQKVCTFQCITEDSIINGHGKRGSCRCWCCLFRREKRCNCRNPNCWIRVGRQKKSKPNPCDSKMTKIWRSCIRDLQNRSLSERRVHCPYSPRITIKRQGCHYHCLHDEDSSGEISNSSGSDDSDDSEEMRPSRESNHLQANCSMSAFQLHNEYTEASPSGLKTTNSILDSYFLLG